MKIATILRAGGNVFIAIYLLGGCTGMTTMPGAARGGDTLLLAVGSPEGMIKDNIAVTFTSDVDHSTVDLTPNMTALIKLQPSKYSAVYLDEVKNIYKTGHEPWISTLAINLPLSVPDGGPLVIGTGTINVSCVPRASCTFPLFFPHTNDADMAVEIIPGTGAPNPYSYDGGILGTINADPASLEDREFVELITTHSTGINGAPIAGPIMGAAEFVINVPMLDNYSLPVPDEDIVVSAEDITSYTGSQRSFLWRRSGDNFTVYFTSPVGMKFPELRFSIVTKPSSHGRPYLFTATPTVVSETYYDLNGNVMTADLPTADIFLNGEIGVPEI